MRASERKEKEVFAIISVVMFGLLCIIATVEMFSGNRVEGLLLLIMARVWFYDEWQWKLRGR